jgi:spore coat protein A
MIRSVSTTIIFCALAVSVAAQNILDPKTQPQFVNPLPIPSVIDARAGGSFTIPISQFEQNLGLIDPVTKQPLLTKVWGYNNSYPGPTILVRKNFPVDILWQNNLTANGQLLPHLLKIDPTVNWAFFGRTDWQTLGIPVVTHLHGGHTESASDGLPQAWYTPNFALTGTGFVKNTLHYSNDQEAATLWYHDHAMGITRLNVYAGLAGFYLVTDENEMQLQATNKLPASPYDIGLAIQDRMFTTDGQLYYTTMPQGAGAPENSIMPEFFGNTILVNGKAWPVLEVEPRQYRFRILNGSDSRFYNLFFSTNNKIIQIGTDDGLLPSPVPMTRLLLGTGERRDVIIDFSDPKLWGKTLVLENNAKTPFPAGTSVELRTTGRIMAFKIVKPLNTSYPLTTLPTTLRPSITPLQTSLPARKLILFEGNDEFNRLRVHLGTVNDGVKSFEDPITENLMQNSTEIWEIYNETPDAHPIHLHLVKMQLVNRQKFSASVDMLTGKPTNIRFQGQPQLPTPDEAGWKDTYIMYPGQVTRVIATFDLAGLYVWHCHILSHEDHEMMRPYLVQPVNGVVTQRSINNSEAEFPVELQIAPNPFNHKLTIQFKLEQTSMVSLNIYDVKGALVKQLYSGSNEPGLKKIELDGANWSNGTYFCQVIINGQQFVRKLILEK